MSNAELIPMQHERAVIGCCLTGTPVDDTGPLPAEAFGHMPHALIWSAMLRLSRRGVEVTTITLLEQLAADGKVAEAGGLPAVLELEQVGAKVSSFHVYAATVREYAARRHIISQAQAAIAGARDLSRRPESVAAEASTRLVMLDSGNGDEAGDVDFLEILGRWDVFTNMTPEQRAAASPFLPMPWAWMREAGVRGFPESLSVVAGRSGIGKTATLSTCMAHWLVNLPHTGAVIGLEDGTAWLDERWIAHRVGIDYADVANMDLNPWQMEKFQEFTEQIGPLLRQKLRKYRRAGMTAAQLIARCKRWVAEGVKWIVVDHGLRVDYEPDGKVRQDVLIGRTVDALANLALNTRTHIIFAWHLNRASEDDSQPTLGDLKESGYLDAAARLILFCWRQMNPPSGEGPRTMLTVGKATKVAPVGLTAELEWSGRSGLFRPDRGRVVDLQAEAVAARQRAQQERAASRRKSHLFPPAAPTEAA